MDESDNEDNILMTKQEFVDMLEKFKRKVIKDVRLDSFPKNQSDFYNKDETQKYLNEIDK